MKPDFSIIPEPDKATVERKPLTRKQRAEILLSQNGYCGCGCGVKVNHAAEGSIDEHLNPLGLTGTNARENRQIWRKPCSDEKTSRDLGDIARAKRMGRETGQQARRAIKGGSIPSRPFPKTKTTWPKRPFKGRET